MATGDPIGFPFRFDDTGKLVCDNPCYCNCEKYLIKKSDIDIIKKCNSIQDLSDKIIINDKCDD